MINVLIPMTFLFNFELAQRKGTPSCWAQLSHPTQAGTQICIHKTQWLEWIKSEHPFSFDGTQQGKWKSYSPLLNTHSNANKRTVFHTKYLKHQPYPYSGNNTLQHQIERVREKTSDLLRPTDRLGLLRSLILHEGTTREPLPILRRLGFIHLITASGIHLYAMTGCLDWILQNLCKTFGIPIRVGLWVGRGLSSLFCLTLWLLGGARMGMLRPWIVLILRAVARYSGVQWTSGAPLICALLVDLFVGTTRTLLGQSGGLHSGRWVYALAVGGGLYWQRSLRYSHLGLAIGSWVLVALWEIWEVGWISLATPLLSLITLPLICLVIYPVSLISLALYWLGLPHLSRFVLSPLSSILDTSVTFLAQVAALPWNLWIIPRTALLGGMLFATLILFIPPHLKGIFKITAGFVPIFLILRLYTDLHMPYLRNTTPADHVVQLDVGQGDSAIIMQGKKVGLIDTGSAHTLKDDDWLRIFSHWQISQISWIALTHLDEDHTGALSRLTRLVRIGCIATSQQELDTPRGQRLTLQLANAEIKITNWETGCVPFPVLGPTRVTQGGRKGKGNANMSAIWVPLLSGGFYLSAGDADARSEIPIGNWAVNLARNSITGPRILKISHHGSRHSTSAPWITTLRPTEAWISAGQGNSYGHPSVQTLDLLNQFHIPIKRTDEIGCIEH